MRFVNREKEIEILKNTRILSKRKLFSIAIWGLRQAENILYDLQEKSKFVDWNNDVRKEHFGLIAKSIYEKAALRGRGFMIFDLDDF
ncbi:MAG: hypothetical protein IMF19_11100 [Proteobacteria bacterium]|nr:hypothetical protein [Pseudomonadota bacterium]